MASRTMSLQSQNKNDMTAVCEFVAKKQHQTTSHDTLIQEYLFFNQYFSQFIYYFF